MTEHNSLHFFSEDGQEAFWKHTTPELVATVSAAELMEDWVHTVEENADLFEACLLAKDLFEDLDSAAVDAEALCDRLISVTHALPFGKAMSYLSILNTKNRALEICQRLYLRAHHIMNTDGQEEQFKYQSKVVYERFTVFAQSNMFADLFITEFNFGERNEH
ncbi:hypothetical protein AB4254_11295 [Vibrio breoganii]